MQEQVSAKIILKVFQELQTIVISLLDLEKTILPLVVTTVLYCLIEIGQKGATQQSPRYAVEFQIYKLPWQTKLG